MRWADAGLAKDSEQIEAFFLPSYSPELNPDEMANADLKQVVTSKARARRTKAQLIRPAATICAASRSIGKGFFLPFRPGRGVGRC